MIINQQHKINFSFITAGVPEFTSGSGCKLLRQRQIVKATRAWGPLSLRCRCVLSPPGHVPIGADSAAQRRRRSSSNQPQRPSRAAYIAAFGSRSRRPCWRRSGVVRRERPRSQRSAPIAGA